LSSRKQLSTWIWWSYY